MTLSEALFTYWRNNIEVFNHAAGEAVYLTNVIDSEGYELHTANLESTLVARFKMRPSLQCSGIAVPYNSFVSPEYRNRGLGRMLHDMRVAAAKMAGFGLMIATTRVDNLNQNRIMERTGWTSLHEFVNPRTQNRVKVWMLTL